MLPMTSEADLAKWQRLDDVIMGGQSSSALTLAADGSGAVFSGDLIIEGGGFCGARTKVRLSRRNVHACSYDVTMYLWLGIVSGQYSAIKFFCLLWP